MEDMRRRIDRGDLMQEKTDAIKVTQVQFLSMLSMPCQAAAAYFV